MMMPRRKPRGPLHKHKWRLTVVATMMEMAREELRLERKARMMRAA